MYLMFLDITHEVPLLWVLSLQIRISYFHVCFFLLLVTFHTQTGLEFFITYFYQEGYFATMGVPHGLGKAPKPSIARLVGPDAP